MKDEGERSSRWVTITLWVTVSWFTMTVTHELGHVVAGLLSGATLVQLELRPWHLPYSIFRSDDHELVTLWAGPMVGCAVPLLICVLVRRPACWFVAWFCVLANSLYLLLGYLAGAGELDSPKMIRAGTHPAVLLGVAAVSLMIGYFKFRRAASDLLAGRTPALSRRGSLVTSAALLGWLVAQTIISAFVIHLVSG